ncbi:hypothetical protein KEM54_001180 [Ascosphaera aggregata]|nr:hypothetical protein KEM54_001180 [Ascosphaera aggregata]
MLVMRLNSGDHALCLNSLQLINSLMRDSLTRNQEGELANLVKRAQDLGVITAVHNLMQGAATHDLAQPLLDFQALAKVILKRWKDIPVVENAEHRRILKSLNAASYAQDYKNSSVSSLQDEPYPRNPEKWRRLGFSTENPLWDFEEVGFLGMLDFVDYVGNNGDEFQRLLVEQANHPLQSNCPVAKASLTISWILYDFYEIGKADINEARSSYLYGAQSNFERYVTPLLLQWQRLHVAGLHAFFRLWRATGAKQEDFHRITDLVQVLMGTVLGEATRSTTIEEVEQEMAIYDCTRLRELQMELLELNYEEARGNHLSHIKEELRAEAVQFVKEQRVRCLLQGNWFPTEEWPDRATPMSRSTHNGFGSGPKAYRYAQLSHNRRFLHYGDFDTIDDAKTPKLESLPQRIDLHSVSSVVSNIPATRDDRSETTIKSHSASSTIKITINGYASRRHSQAQTPAQQQQQHLPKSGSEQEETALLVLYPQSHSVASEWLDGLLMLLDQQHITAETEQLMNVISDFGVKIRMLNVKFDETSLLSELPEVPSREGLDDNYYYDMVGNA